MITSSYNCAWTAGAKNCAIFWLEWVAKISKKIIFIRSMFVELVLASKPGHISLKFLSSLFVSDGNLLAIGSRQSFAHVRTPATICSEYFLRIGIWAKLNFRCVCIAMETSYYLQIYLLPACQKKCRSKHELWHRENFDCSIVACTLTCQFLTLFSTNIFCTYLSDTFCDIAGTWKCARDAGSWSGIVQSRPSLQSNFMYDHAVSI